MPIPYSAANLKARFETGDIPTQQDFADLIDTFQYLFQFAQDTAAEAKAVVAANYRVHLVADWLGGNSAHQNPVITVGVNVESVIFVDAATPGYLRYRITFQKPFANALWYNVQDSITASPSGADPALRYASIGNGGRYPGYAEFLIAPEAARVFINLLILGEGAV